VHCSGVSNGTYGSFACSCCICIFSGAFKAIVEAKDDIPYVSGILFDTSFMVRE
jgi:hypothetical protein